MTFTDDEIKEYITGALRNSTGDNLERCEMAFKGMSAVEMQRDHGQSGISRENVLLGYQRERELFNVATETLKNSGLYYYKQCQKCKLNIHKKPYIVTCDGHDYIDKGDWIITDMNGIRYPVTPDIFEETYELVE